MSELIQMPDSVKEAIEAARAAAAERDEKLERDAQAAAELVRQSIAENAAAAGIDYTPPVGPAPEETFLGNSNAPSMHRPIGGPRDI